MRTLESKIRRVIMDEALANHYDEAESKPGMSTAAFCGICKKETGGTGVLMCDMCAWSAFHRGFTNRLTREMRSLDTGPKDVGKSVGAEVMYQQVKYAIGFVRRSIVFQETLRAARRG